MTETPRTMTEAIKLRERKEREDFAARVRGEHADTKAFRQYVRSELRLAYRRAKLHAEAIHEAAKMIEAGVDIGDALASIRDAMDYVMPIVLCEACKAATPLTEAAVDGGGDGGETHQRPS